MLNSSTERGVEFCAIIDKMRAAGETPEFLFRVILRGAVSEGVEDLVFLWDETSDETERAAIIADLKELINE